MVLSLIGPLNNIFGPGLAIEVITNVPITPGAQERADVFFHLGSPIQTTEVVAEGSSFFRSNGTSTIIIGRTVLTQPSAYRTGQSAGGELMLTIFHLNNASQNVEPPQGLGPVSWDPVLQMGFLINAGAGGGLTPAQEAKLDQIISFVSTTYLNSP